MNLQAQIGRDVFRQSHTCARIFDKVTKQYDYWLLELSKDTRDPQFMTWAREATPDFLKVVEQYQALF